jgi:sugar lactone lactonase YvrE
MLKINKFRLWTLAIALALISVASLGGSVLASASSATFPKIIPVPNGFYPEGIAIGRGTDFYVGSLLNGAIYSGDLRTGEGSILVPGQEGHAAGGLDLDRRTNYLFVAGVFGTARVYDAATGELLAEYQLTTESFPSTLINDVIVTRDAAYFTDTFRPVFYRIPLGPGGTLPDTSAVEEIPLGCGFDFVPGELNANGIVATPDGKWLIINNTFLGTLYRVNPITGEATEIDLGDDTLPSGDGLLLDGKKLYVVQNFLNQISVVRLDSHLESGTVVGVITDEAFRVPTTIAGFGSSIYAINARFDVALPPFFGGPPPDPNLEFEIVKVSKLSKH